MNSGYALIDFGGLDLTAESAVTKTGLNAALVKALGTGKTIVGGGLKYSSKACAPAAILVVPDSSTSTTINVYLSKFMIAVTSADSCTVTDLTASAAKTTKK